MATPHQTANGTVAESPLVLVDVATTESVVGHGIVFTYNMTALKPTAELVANLAPLVEGEELAPAALEGKLARRFRLLGTQGLVGMALSGIDMALWDALARVHKVSLLNLLGGAPRPIPAYGAVGYDGPKQSGAVAEDWVRRGFRGVKAKIGYPTVAGNQRATSVRHPDCALARVRGLVEPHLERPATCQERNGMPRWRHRERG